MLFLYNIQILCDLINLLKFYIYYNFFLTKKSSGEYKISIDLLDHRGFEYYTGITFSIFCLNSSKEVCRGGRYLTSKNKDAVGATFFLNQFLQLNNTINNKRKKLLVSFGSIFDKNLQKLRKKGWIIIQNIDSDNDKKIAKLHNCKFIFKNNKIKALK